MKTGSLQLLRLSLVELTGEVLVDPKSQETAASTVTPIMLFFLAICVAAALGSPPFEKRGGLLLIKIYYSVYSSRVVHPTSLRYVA